MENDPPIGARARRTNPALAPLSFLIGEWVTNGRHPMVPDKLTGRTSFAWHEGGAFILMRSQVDDDRFPDGVAIIGSDDSSGKLAMSYFDERGISRLMEVTGGEEQVAWHHDDPKFAQRLTLRADGPDRMASEGQMSENGGPWTDDLSQTFERA